MRYLRISSAIAEHDSTRYFSVVVKGSVEEMSDLMGVESTLGFAIRLRFMTDLEST